MIVNVFVPAAVGVPVPVRVRLVGVLATALTVGELKLKPFTVVVVAVTGPAVAYVCDTTMVLVAPNAVPAVYVPCGVAPQGPVGGAVPATTVTGNVQVDVPPVTVKLFVPTAAGLPLPCKVI